ncbi:hypothetical protein QEZ54_07240 [Catellatospora sp. KI3]|uniref:hypothetical protein n=1 Tax=Catellatospora sp. KI3 TaxID=3041620 RepID=UPI0024832A5E|nr:hypothetical protein [Catellatospora sp. KI3]MDI1460754.1 hypothetical protein [Catellatospora sp. KI3]
MPRKHGLLLAAAALLLATITSSPATAAGPDLADTGTLADAPPAAAVDWEGLPTWNQGYGPLRNQTNGLKALRYSVRDYGINLGWTDWPNSRWEVYAEGLAPDAPITSTTKVALRVADSPGYIRWGAQNYGIDLVWSSTPVYEWNLISTPSGQALFNTNRRDYMVYGGRFWGVNLIWLSDMVASPSPTQGVKTYTLQNCHDAKRAVQVWVSDMDTGGAWVDKGRLNSQWSGTSCPVVGQPFTFSPTVSNHRFRVRAIDFGAPGCTNDPTLCVIFENGFISDVNGYIPAPDQVTGSR